MPIALIHPAIIHVPARKAFMVMPMMAVMISTSVPILMSVVPAPYVLIWRAVIAATVLQVMTAMDVQKLVVLISMNVPVHLAAVMLNV